MKSSSRVEYSDGSRLVISASNYLLQLDGALMIDVNGLCIMPKHINNNGRSLHSEIAVGDIGSSTEKSRFSNRNKKKSSNNVMIHVGVFATPLMGLHSRAMRVTSDISVLE
jgi:hypothetical protein